MKIAIVGGGNMGGAVAQALSQSNTISPKDITVINKSRIVDYGQGIKSVISDYSSLNNADVVIFAVKPWLLLEVINSNRDSLISKDQIIVSLAAGIDLQQLAGCFPSEKAIFRAMPNTAIAQRQSMTFISSMNANISQIEQVVNIFKELGKCEYIEEEVFKAGTAISGCGIAYAFKYVRATMQAGVEMGLSSQQAKEAVIQTLKGAVALLEANDSHPDEEIDKVTTPGGLTIKGINELEHAGFTSAIIRGVKASV